MGTALTRQDVPAAFDAAAAAYDRLVGLNPGYHANLREAAATARQAGPHILDAGCGTGASTAALLAADPGAAVVAVDASRGMLDVARAKEWPGSVRFVHSRVETLPDAGVRGPFDAAFAAYLVRNLPDPDATLTTLRRLLRPGGLLVVHDYSLSPNLLPRLTWHAVCWSMIIPAGRLAAGDARLYRYLWRSVRRFDSPPRFADRLRAAGFTDVGCRGVGGWQRGIVHTFHARKARA
ncbi:ubiquinone/menaquinone biosynthesis C-methylase UbiE [Saccharomonospora amisosensis]|uniref:Ubiquinone/menaquinone biosynthesis C-methylase UbiE n=1 Tax=Saccharomonospora amisosensis TaxID=1128677 RepID=A0A7X5UPB8_9PSEU|nr:class I SAM-dependent methyltransferase [Saccharomonospora amisosensis]NIJ11717.1 ubiquinone/menaquinone biosynthesis C-methylase UbiE [Saccharomonospora amisosensis]